MWGWWLWRAWGAGQGHTCQQQCCCRLKGYFKTGICRSTGKTAVCNLASQLSECLEAGTPNTANRKSHTPAAALPARHNPVAPAHQANFSIIYQLKTGSRLFRFLPRLLVDELQCDSYLGPYLRLCQLPERHLLNIDIIIGHRLLEGVVMENELHQVLGGRLQRAWLDDRSRGLAIEHT